MTNLPVKSGKFIFLYLGVIAFQVRSFVVRQSTIFKAGLVPDSGEEHEWRLTNSLLLAKRNRNGEDDDKLQDDKSIPMVPQLPAFGAWKPPAPRSDGVQSKNKGNDEAAFVSTKFQLQYTCKVCETRNSHIVSRIAYREGVVIAICKGCKSKHLIADNLGTASLDGDTNIEDYFKTRGMDHAVNRVTQEVFDLEKMLFFDTAGGALVGDGGNPVLE